MSTQSQALISYCEALNRSAKKACDWVDRFVEDPRREDTLLKLKKIRRLSNRYRLAAGKRPSVALFGESQVGKTYLVKTIAKLPNAETQEIFIPQTGQKYNFNDIQPEGNNAETTGIVTRFTTQRFPAKPGYPLYVSLLSQADIVKILAVAYLNNIKDRVYEITEARLEEIDQKLIELSALQSINNLNQGLTEDDIYDIEEYINFKSRNEDVVKSLKDSKFWKKIADLLPKTPYNRRIELFTFIWGQQPFFNQIFTLLSETLRTLNFSTSVFAHMDAIVPKTETILTIERYFSLLDKDPKPLRVVTEHGSEVDINRNALSSLTAELVLNVPDELIENEDRRLFRKSDLLDFPGARSAKQFQERSLDNVNSRELLELFVRGKVAFLFDRYNDHAEISALGYCIHNKQCDVTDLPKLVATWIDRAIGDTPEKRLERENRLSNLVADKSVSRINQMFVILTKANTDLVGTIQDIDNIPSSHDGKWEARYKKFFRDFLSNGTDYNWPDQWTGASGQYTSFKNIFPIRDPQYYQATIYNGVKPNGLGQETELKPEYTQRYQDMRTSFVSNPYVKRYSYNPEECWNEFSQLNKSGIDYLLRYLTPACDPIIKQEQIKGLATELQHELYTCLQQYHRGDQAEEIRKAQAQARRFDAQFAAAQLSRNVTGRLLNALLLPEEVCAQEYRDLVNRPENYLTVATDSDVSTNSSVSLYDFADSLALLSSPLSDTDTLLTQLDEYWGCDRATTLEMLNEASVVIEKPKPAVDKAMILSRNLLSRLMQQFSSVAADEFYTQRLGLSRELLGLIVGQLKQNIERVGLYQKLADTVREEIKAFHSVDNSNFDLVARTASAFLNKFVATAGYGFLDTQQRPLLTGATGQKVFPENRLLRQEKEAIVLTLPNKKIPGESIYTSWRLAISDSFVANIHFIYGSSYRQVPDPAYVEFEKFYADMPSPA